MSANFKQIIEEVKQLNPRERALVAHCLISSLDTRQDDGVDLEWTKLAEKRYNDLISGEVNPVSWESIKKEVKG